MCSESVGKLYKTYVFYLKLKLLFKSSQAFAVLESNSHDHLALPRYIYIYISIYDIYTVVVKG